MSKREVGFVGDWISRARIGDLTEDAKRILDGRYGAYVALIHAERYFAMLGQNALVPAQSKICAEQVVAIRRVLKRPHMRKLARELADAGYRSA